MVNIPYMDDGMGYIWYKNLYYKLDDNSSLIYENDGSLDSKHSTASYTP